MITPYSKTSTIEFWTDPYISKKLLEAHLDQNNNLASRLPKTIKKTCDFIETLVGKQSKIADFGCGPGLYTNILDSKGYEVYGIDISKNSIEYAKKRNTKINYQVLDYTKDHLKTKVDFIQMIYCDFGALSPYAQVHTLKNISESLKDNGLFLFDVMSDHFFEGQSESYSRRSEVNGFFIEGKADILEQTVLYDQLRLVMRHIVIDGKSKKEFFNYDKCYNIKEMDVLLKDNNFEIMEVFSDTMGNKDFAESETLCFLCRRIK